MVAGGPEPQALERFQRDVARAMEIDHPGVVQVLDGGVVDGTPFVAYEYVDGESVAAVVEGRSVSAAEALELVRELSETLAPVHRAGPAKSRGKQTGSLMCRNGILIFRLGFREVGVTFLPHPMHSRLHGGVRGGETFRCGKSYFTRFCRTWSVPAGSMS